MSLRKILIAVDCIDDAQKDRIQLIMNEISGMKLLDGGKIESIYPFFRSHQNELYQLFSMVSKSGIKSIMSGQGLNLITKLTMR